MLVFMALFIFFIFLYIINICQYSYGVPSKVAASSQGCGRQVPMQPWSQHDHYARMSEALRPKRVRHSNASPLHTRSRPARSCLPSLPRGSCESHWKTRGPSPTDVPNTTPWHGKSKKEYPLKLYWGNLLSTSILKGTLKLDLKILLNFDF